MNWKNSLAEYIKNPLFMSYGNFTESRPVLVDCSFGVNPLGAGASAEKDRLFKSERLEIELAPYSMYPAGGAHGNRLLESYVLTRWPRLDPARLCFSSGSYGAISNLTRVLGGGKTLIRGYLPQFIPALMEFSTAGSPVQTLKLTAPDYEYSVEALLNTLDGSTGLLYLDNPNNPTGRALPLADIARLAEGCAERGVLLLSDEAYADFIDDADSALNLPHKNIICVRSFSKGCGLAGMRVGFAHMHDPDLLHYYSEFGMQFGCSALAADVAARVLPQVDLAAMRLKLAALKKEVMEFIGAYGAFHIASTHASTPIFLLSWREPGSLYDRLMDHGIMTEPGRFFALGEDSVRLRIPGPDHLALFKKQWQKAFGSVI